MQILIKIGLNPAELWPKPFLLGQLLFDFPCLLGQLLASSPLLNHVIKGRHRDRDTPRTAHRALAPSPLKRCLRNFRKIIKNTVFIDSDVFMQHRY